MIPDLTDTAAMIERGRRSALHAARKDAMEQLRDAYTELQAARNDDIKPLAEKAIEAAQMLIRVQELWDSL